MCFLRCSAEHHKKPGDPRHGNVPGLETMSRSRCAGLRSTCAAPAGSSGRGYRPLWGTRPAQRRRQPLTPTSPDPEPQTWSSTPRNLKTGHRRGRMGAPGYGRWTKRVRRPLGHRRQPALTCSRLAAEVPRADLFGPVERPAYLEPGPHQSIPDGVEGHVGHPALSFRRLDFRCDLSAASASFTRGDGETPHCVGQAPKPPPRVETPALC